MPAARSINDGKLIEPTFLPRTQEEAEKTARSSKKSTSDDIRSLLHLNGEQGSGEPPASPASTSAARRARPTRSSTAATSTTLNFNSFLAAFPIDNPQYVVLTFID